MSRLAFNSGSHSRWAYVVSTVFHPMIMPTQLALLFLTSAPDGWNARSTWSLGGVFLGTAVAPALTAFVLHRMNLVSAFQLPLRTDRQWPLAVAAAGFYWAYKLNARWGFPEVLTWSLLAGCATVFLVYGALLWTKASGHTAGMAAASSSIALASLEWGWSPWPLLCSILILTAIVAARLQLRAHTPAEIGWGLLFGALPAVTLLVVRW